MKLCHQNHFITSPSSLLHYRLYRFSPLSSNPVKMVKHTQTIRRQQPTNYLSVFDHFVGLVLKGLKSILQDHPGYEPMILLTYNSFNVSFANYSRNQVLSKLRLGYESLVFQNFDRTNFPFY